MARARAPTPPGSLLPARPASAGPHVAAPSTHALPNPARHRPVAFRDHNVESAASLDSVDHAMLARFVAAGAEYAFEWPSADEHAALRGLSAAHRLRLLLGRRRRNALAITKIDVATRAAFCSGPPAGSGIRSYSSLPERSRSATSSVVSLRPARPALRSACSVHTLALPDAPANVRYDYRHMPSSFVAATETLSGAPWPRQSAARCGAPLLALSHDSGNAQVRGPPNPWHAEHMRMAHCCAYRHGGSR